MKTRLPFPHHKHTGSETNVRSKRLLPQPGNHFGRGASLSLEPQVFELSPGRMLSAPHSSCSRQCYFQNAEQFHKNHERARVPLLRRQVAHHAPGVTDYADWRSCNTVLPHHKGMAQSVTKGVQCR